MPYAENSAYNKFQTDCDCGDSSSDCGCNTNSCGCCPIGTIEVKDSCGNHVACLLPADYALYVIDTIVVPEGYIKAFNPTTGDYVGLLTVAEYTAYLALFP